jgi:predicted nucleic acid-binding protein
MKNIKTKKSKGLFKKTKTILIKLIFEGYKTETAYYNK